MFCSPIPSLLKALTDRMSRELTLLTMTLLISTPMMSIMITSASEYEWLTPVISSSLKLIDSLHLNFFSGSSMVLTAWTYFFLPECDDPLAVRPLMMTWISWLVYFGLCGHWELVPRVGLSPFSLLSMLSLSSTESLARNCLRCSQLTTHAISFS